MATENSVKDEKGKLTDEQIGKLYRKTNEIIRRVNEGTILYDDSLEVMQKIIIENHSAPHLSVVYGESLIVYQGKKWYEENGVIHIKVTSDGTTGKQWISRLEKKGFKLSKYAKGLLLSKDFKATTGIVYTIAVLKGNLFTDSNRVTEEIRSEAAKRKLVTPNPEVACLIREMFSDDEIKAMGLTWIITMHKPIKDSVGDLRLLCAHRCGGGSWLNTDYGLFVYGRDSYYGFAFEVSQVEL